MRGQSRCGSSLLLLFSFVHWCESTCTSINKREGEGRPAVWILPAEFPWEIKIDKVKDKDKEKEKDMKGTGYSAYAGGILYWDILAKVSKEGYGRSC